MHVSDLMERFKPYRGWLRLLGVVILVALVLLFRIDLRKTLELLGHADPLAVTLAVVLFTAFLASKAWRWQVILADLGIPVRFGEAIKLYALGVGAGMVTPGQLGDAVKVAYFRDRGLGRALVSVLLDRLWDLLILLLLAGTGAFMFWRELESEWLLLAILAVGTVALLAVTASPRAQAWLLARLEQARGGENGRIAYEPVRLAPLQILRQFALTLLATAVVYSRLYLLATAMNIHLEPIPFIATMSLATVAALLPISVAGVGARDAALILVAPLIGISPEQALGLSALILLLNVVNGLVGFGVWLIWKPAPAVATPAAAPPPRPLGTGE